MSELLRCQFKVHIDGPPDVRGDRRRYFPGPDDQVEASFAIYAVAMGYAKPIDEWPAETMQTVAAVGELIALFRAERVDPTFRDILTALARMGAQSNAAAAGAPATR